MRTTTAFLALLLATVALTACGGGGEDPPPTPMPTVDPFDPNLMTAIVLQPDDVGMQRSSGGFSADPAVPSYSVVYGGEDFYVQSTLTRAVDPIARDENFRSLRNFLAGFVADERTLTMEGTQEAYAYASFAFNAPRQSVLVMTDEFVAFVDVGANNEARGPDVHAVPIEDYMRIILDRIAKSRETPPAITAIPGAPTFAPPADDVIGEETPAP